MSCKKIEDPSSIGVRTVVVISDVLFYQIKAFPTYQSVVTYSLHIKLLPFIVVCILNMTHFQQ